MSQKFNPEDVGLGRKRVYDSRDEEHLIRSVLPKRKISVPYRYWNNNGGWFDQLQTDSCVGHGWAHWLEDGPITQMGKATALDPHWIYKEAQKVDEWPGEDYGGTSVRAGAKILQREGYISSYKWAFNLQDLIDTILIAGPVVVGTTWYEQMFYPDSKGWVRIGGSVVGGHCWKIDGVNIADKKFRAKNSWGNGKIPAQYNNWGLNGVFYVGFNNMGALLEDYGEVCLANEIKK